MSSVAQTTGMNMDNSYRTTLHDQVDECFLRTFVLAATMTIAAPGAPTALANPEQTILQSLTKVQDTDHSDAETGSIADTESIGDVSTDNDSDSDAGGDVNRWHGIGGRITAALSVSDDNVDIDGWG